jgi:adenylylsulfate kinase
MKSSSSGRSGRELLATSSDLRSRERPQSSRESNVCPKRQSSLTAFEGRAYARRVRRVDSGLLGTAQERVTRTDDSHVAFLESAGAGLQEGAAALGGFGHLSPGTAARLGVIDAVIDPAETRRRVAGVFLDRGSSVDSRSGRFVRDTRRGPEAPQREGCAVWFTGPPCSGKSTVAALVERELRALGEKVEVLDGDAVRENLCKGLGFSRQDRDTNVRRIAFVADALSRNGVHVLAAAISPYRETRDEVRASMGNRFVEVHVKAPLEERLRRDQRGLYAKALRGELPGFTSVSDPYEEPLAPELVLDTERETPEESAERVLALLDRRTAPDLAA